ncbi:hypothetical protein [Tuwongella immobilis]|uniref:Uncharacterized protein n=1 Tax=Tuwongella immobilis TaxID=692036 RepID=A0A6C2YSP3_9BACT|nr:hypothetical protein [Tuwongella immobilis]VIP03975.1 unnamed protein product [Tuwongella immobilis]VTS05317.1 unnamed protein product [Tuwongella immobilis]
MGQTYLADALATPEQIEFEGITLEFMPWDTLAVIANFERFAIRQALAEVDKLRPAPGSDITDHALFSQLKDSVESKIAAGYFRYGNVGYSQAQASPLGMEELLFQCLRVNHPIIDRQFVKRMMASDQAPAILEALQRISVDPNRGAGAKPA